MENTNKPVCKIVLPLPAKELSPNYCPGSFGGRINKSKKAKKYRAMACQLLLAEDLQGLPFDKVSVKPVYYHKVKRRRDVDNFMGCLKSAYDGLVDGGLCEDDNWEIMEKLPPSFEIDKPHPRVELIIFRI